VANLTHDSRRPELPLGELEALAIEAQDLKVEFLDAVDADAQAFDAVMLASRLPRGTDAERAARNAAVRDATRTAAEVPLGVLRRAAQAARLAATAARIGSPAALSDAGVAALCAATAAEAAAYNVLINLGTLHAPEDAEFVRRTRDEVDLAVRAAESTAAETRRAVRERLGKPGS
jgi:methenyltetrahydrofolate cyclohydrolase